MKRIVYFFTFFCIFLFVFSSPLFAVEEFTTICHSYYQIFENGDSSITQEVSIINQRPDIYVSEYTFKIVGQDIQNIKAWDKAGPLKIKSSTENDETTLEISFNEKVVGKDSTLSFIIKYEVPKLAKKEGQLWKVMLPKLNKENSPDQYSLELKIPISFGSLAFASPYPQKSEKKGENVLYFFEKNDFIKYGIILEFGSYQIYKFELNYQLENLSDQLVGKEISLPPDTNYQLVEYQKIAPVFKNIRRDIDGNWLASYDLLPNQKIEISAVGRVKIFSSPVNILPILNQLSDNYLKPNSYWEVDDEKIRQISSNLKTPKEIYDYVVNLLNYDYERVNKDPERFGALKTLSRPKDALCLEFTDLFVTLARASGIPAREIEGYAQTNDPQLRPLSLSSDILHSWGEFYDFTSSSWRMVDTTWGKTTGGYDYLNNFDMSHFTFVIHGLNPQLPPPAGAFKYKQDNRKNIFVEFDKDAPSKNNEISILLKIKKVNLLKNIAIWSLLVENLGPSASYNLEVNFADFEQFNQKIEYLLPFEKKNLEIEIKNVLSFLKMKSDVVIIRVGNQEFKQKLNINELAKTFLIQSLKFLILFLVCLITLKKLTFSLIKKMKLPRA